MCVKSVHRQVRRISHHVDVQVSSLEADGDLEAHGDQQRLRRLKLRTTVRLYHRERDRGRTIISNVIYFLQISLKHFILIQLLISFKLAFH